VSSAGAEATGGGSIAPALSADGRYIAFDSSATNLVAGDTNGKRDVFVYDRTTRQTTMVSVSSDGTPGNGDSMSASISADGRYVAFLSQATNLVTGDTNGLADVFVHDRQTGETTRVNLGPSGLEANSETWPDGDLGRYTYDEMANTQVAISGDGRYVAFVSLATNLAAAPPDTVPVGVCVRDRETGTTSCITTPIAAGNAPGMFRPSVALSSDGRYVAIATSGQHVANDTNGQRDVYVYDRNSGQMERVSVSTAGIQGDHASGWPAISADGRYVAFGSDATNLIAGEINGARTIYLRDRQTGVTTRIPGVHVARAVQPAISGDGRYVAYSMPLFGLSVFDSHTNIVRAVTDAGPADGESFGAAISADGQIIAFGSASADLVGGDTNNQDDVFVVSAPPTTLVFGAVISGATFTSQTSPQTFFLTASNSASWTVTADKPWIRMSTTSGVGSAALVISVQFTPGLVATQTGSITVLAGTSELAVITVSLNTYSQTLSGSPFGSFDTPTSGTAGVAGSIGVTGWALDDVEVTEVTVCRGRVAGEAPAADQRCGGDPQQAYIGDATFVDGARPDVETQFPSWPLVSRAGWGYLMLTNFLPNRGNGPFTLTAYALDTEGHVTALGKKSISCDNAHSAAPFGAIDTPGQGAVVTGIVGNTGWVLSPRVARADPPGGGVVRVLVDGIDKGAPASTLWTARADLQALFPKAQYPGVDTALGIFGLDTTTLSDGVHTIAWIVTATAGGTSGVGSRFFTVFNGSLVALTTSTLHSPVPMQASLRMTSSARQISNVDAAPVDMSTILARRGFDLEQPLQPVTPRNDRSIVQAEELDRIEVHLSATAGHHYSGYLRTGASLMPLPIGSTLDASTGTFTWMPGVAFVGGYDLLFVRWSGGAPIARQEVRVILNPKGSNRVGPQTIIDAPGPGRRVFRAGEAFYLGGWAADLDSTSGTGVDTVHVWAYPVDALDRALDPIFLGAATYGGARPDVGAVYGSRFASSGYGVTVDTLLPGTYDIAVFAYSTVMNDFTPAKVVQVTVR
jgi:Tol biopolymer transport system component